MNQYYETVAKVPFVIARSGFCDEAISDYEVTEARRDPGLLRFAQNDTG